MTFFGLSQNYENWKQISASSINQELVNLKNFADLLKYPTEIKGVFMQLCGINNKIVGQVVLVEPLGFKD